MCLAAACQQPTLLCCGRLFWLLGLAPGRPWCGVSERSVFCTFAGAASDMAHKDQRRLHRCAQRGLTTAQRAATTRAGAARSATRQPARTAYVLTGRTRGVAVPRDRSAGPCRARHHAGTRAVAYTCDVAAALAHTPPALLFG